MSTNEKFSVLPVLALATLSAPIVLSIICVSESSSLAYSLNLYNVINSFRTKHTVPALRWNRTLTDIADTFAMRILTLDSYDIEDYEGVNFFITPGTTRPQALFVAETWYNESFFYDYNNPGYNPLYLNYTQMVWKSSTSVGIGTYTDTENNYTSIVAKFYPMGNLNGKFRQNVIAKYKRLR